MAPEDGHHNTTPPSSPPAENPVRPEPRPTRHSPRPAEESSVESLSIRTLSITNPEDETPLEDSSNNATTNDGALTESSPLPPRDVEEGINDNNHHLTLSRNDDAVEESSNPEEVAVREPDRTVASGEDEHNNEYEPTEAERRWRVLFQEMQQNNRHGIPPEERLRLQHYLHEGDGANGDDDASSSSSSSSSSSLVMNPCCERCLDVAGRLVCVPIAFVVTVSTVVTVLSLCVLPSLLLIGTALTLYYCCSRDPIPIRVLLRAMLLDGEPDPDGMTTPIHRRTKSEIQPYLLRRECVAIHLLSNSNNNNNNDNPPPPSVPDGGLVVDTHDRQFFFSAPLVTSSSSHPTDDDEEQQQQQRDNSSSSNNNNSILLVPDHNHPEDENDIELVNIPILVTQQQQEQQQPPEIEDYHSAVGEEPKEGEEEKEEMTDPAPVGGSWQFPPPSLDDEHAPSNHHHHDDADDDNHSRQSDVSSSLNTMQEHERGAACDICLRLYRVGEIVAWSHNPACDHAYHCDCITDWLLHQQQQHRSTSSSCRTTSSSCPNCRADFLYAVEERTKPSSQRRRRSGSGHPPAPHHHRDRDNEDHSNISSTTTNPVPPV